MFLLKSQKLEQNKRMLSQLNFQNIEQTQVIMYLQAKNQQLTSDNMILANQIYRLRGIIDLYQVRLKQLSKIEKYHQQQLQLNKINTTSIINRIDKSDTHTTMQVQNQFKQLKKQVFYKKMEAMETRYEKKNQLCQQLLGFKDKIERLRNTWELKNKDTSLQSLFIWVYNQIVKAKGSAPTKPRNTNKKSNSNKNIKQNISLIKSSLKQSKVIQQNGSIKNQNNQYKQNLFYAIN